MSLRRVYKEEYKKEMGRLKAQRDFKIKEKRRLEKELRRKRFKQRILHNLKKNKRKGTLKRKK